MLNKKGFAMSSMIYSILILFILLIFCILGILASRKLVLDKLKNKVLAEINSEKVVIIPSDPENLEFPE